MAHSSFWRGRFGLALLLTPFSLVTQAQSSAVTGRLLDAATSQPVPFATVVLLRAGADSAVAVGGQSDAAGTFQLSGPAPGNYRLRASAVGYATWRRELTLTGADQNLGELRLASVAAQLGEVRVEGQQAIVQESLDKKVINVAKDLTSVGGTAVNVLQNIPSLNVDQNGQISLRGTTSVTVWINGKPSGAGASGPDALGRIPASSIDRVEIITNPSARYDASNAGGIINIILKKPKENGTNGSVGLNVGTRDKYNGQLSLNRKQGRWNWFGEYSFSHEHFHNRWDTDQTTQLESREEVLSQQSRQDQFVDVQVGRAGFDFTPSPEHTISFSAQPVLNTFRTREQVAVALTRSPTDVLHYAGHNDNVLPIRSVDLTTDYRRTWAQHPGRELTASALYTFADGTQRLEQAVGGPFQRQTITFNGPQAQAQVDYVLPLGEKGPRLETGLKGLYRNFDGDYRFYLASSVDTPEQLTLDTRRSPSYRYDDMVSAAYVQAAKELGKVSVQAGLRAEHTYAHATLRDGDSTVVQRDYLSLFPSATVNHKVSETQEVQLAYSRRINRPDISQLLPMPNYADPRNIRQGNPQLRPELIDALELGHQKSWGGATLSTTAFYRRTTSVIQRYRYVDKSLYATTPDGDTTTVTRTLFINVGHNTTYGLETSLQQPVAKWLRLSAFASGYRNEVSSLTGTEVDRRNWMWSGRLNMTVTPVKKLDVQLSGNYRSAMLTNQGRMEPFYGVDVAVQTRVLHDRGTISLRTSDVFNTQAFDVHAYGPGLLMHQYIKRETRLGYLGFTYNFGDAQFRRQQRRNAPQGGGGGLG